MSTPPGVDQLLRSAQQKAQQEQEAQMMLEMSLRVALHQPHTIQRYKVHRTAVAYDGANPVFLVGLPTGMRLEIELTAETAQGVAKALSEEQAQQEAA